MLDLRKEEAVLGIRIAYLEERLKDFIATTAQEKRVKTLMENRLKRAKRMLEAVRQGNPPGAAFMGG